MINKELFNFVEQQTEQGVENNIMIDSLLANGWERKEVEEAIFSVSANSGQIKDIVVPVSSNNKVAKNRIWSKIIPRTNRIFLTIYLLLVFGVDLMFILSDNSLVSFWYIMLAVFAVYFIFFSLENTKYKNDFSGSSSKLDSYILVIIVVRNILFLLNFIPFIQIAGLVALPFVGLPLILIYFILIFIRDKNMDKTVVSAVVS